MLKYLQVVILSKLISKGTGLLGVLGQLWLTSETWLVSEYSWNWLQAQYLTGKVNLKSNMVRSCSQMKAFCKFFFFFLTRHVFFHLFTSWFAMYFNRKVHKISPILFQQLLQIIARDSKNKLVSPQTLELKNLLLYLFFHVLLVVNIVLCGLLITLGCFRKSSFIRNVAQTLRVSPNWRICTRHFQVPWKSCLWWFYFSTESKTQVKVYFFLSSCWVMLCFLLYFKHWSTVVSLQMDW